MDGSICTTYTDRALHFITAHMDLRTNTVDDLQQYYSVIYPIRVRILCRVKSGKTPPMRRVASVFLPAVDTVVFSFFSEVLYVVT